MKNTMKLEILAQSVNESFARSAVAAFALPLNPSLSALSDIKTAVSEGVTNAIVHAYRDEADEDKKKIFLEAEIFDEKGRKGIHIVITDHGKGIEDVPQAISPFYTTLDGEERSGMGFTVMQTFMTDMQVESEPGKGTRVTLTKILDEDER